MGAYSYSAINAQGIELFGELLAADEDAAREQLRQKGLVARSLAETSAIGEAKAPFKRVKAKSLQVFTRQFATMIEAGLDIVTALVVLEEQTTDRYLAEVTTELREDVERGLLLSQACARHPKVFSPLFVAMVEAGEAAGILDIVLDRVAMQIEKEAQLKRRVKGAMIYPSIVLAFAFLVLNAMLLFLVPIFVKIFSELGGQLPMLTQWVMKASALLRHDWFIIFPVLAVLVVGFFRGKRTERGRQLWDRFKLRIPMKIATSS